MSASKKLTEALPEFITIEEAMKLIEESWGRKVYTSKQALYRKIHHGKLDRFGPPKMALLNKAQVIKKLCAPQV